jgi:site-specific recombinase XerD
MAMISAGIAEIERDWADHMISRLSSEVAKRYRLRTTRYVEWLLARGLSLTTADQNTIYDYLGEVPSKEALSAIRAMYDFLVARSYMAESPVQGIAPLKSSTGPRFFDETVVHAFLDQLEYHNATEHKSRDALIRARTWAIAELIYSSALTVKDIQSLRREALDLSALSVTVGKRAIPFTPRAGNAIARWLRARDKKWPEPARLLFHSTGDLDAGAGSRTTALMRSLFEVEGPRLTASDLRIAYICHSAQRGMSIANLQRLTGLGAVYLQTILDARVPRSDVSGVAAAAVG